MSLRLRLLAILGLSLTAVWSLVAIWMFFDVRYELRTALDDRLAASARMVAGLMTQLPPASVAGIGRTPSPLDVVARDGLACEVSRMRGEIIGPAMARTTGSPALASAAPGYGTHVFGGKRWRTYVLIQHGVRVATADRIDMRERLLRTIALSAGIPFVIALLGSLAALWFGIGRGLAPLERIRSALAERRADDATPLPDTPAPKELRPLVATVRHLLERVQDAIFRERRFTDDAAHELRTPLTAIKTHLQVLRLAMSRPDGVEAAAQALTQADQGVLRLQRTLEQLLLLARMEAPSQRQENDQTDVAVALRQAVGQVEAALGLNNRIGLDDQLCGCERLSMPEALLVAALSNLLHNAVRHASTGPVVLRATTGGVNRIRLSVLDEGVGLSPEECVLAKQRFWRRGDAGAPGSGLGLAIVDAIARHYGGELTLSPRQPHGLCAELTFGLASADDDVRGAA